MLLTFRDQTFIAESSFREKDIPKGAGMRWNPAAKRWETLDWHVALKLAGMCDGAMKRDGSGFNRYDARIGQELAVQESLTAKQAALGRKLLRKYHGQLEGISWPNSARSSSWQ